MKFLVLEDHPAIHLVIRQTIEKLFNEVEIVSHQNSNEAIEEFDKEDFSFIITDIQIQDRKELALAKKCATKEIPFMVYTSHLNRTIIDTCFQLGCKAYVCKTAPVEELATGINSMVNGLKFYCDATKKYIENTETTSDIIPEISYTEAELPIILAQIKGESTIDLSKRLNKSKSTIRNQRIHLMLKNGCSMEEVARRYLYWHTQG
jgi:DNA-binding NarL/FixJ family response regulator